MQLIAIRSGEVVMDLGRVAGGPPGAKRTLPIMSFLITTDDDVVLFDTGMNPAVREDPVGHWGQVAHRVLVPVLPPGADVPQRLRDLGRPPESVTVIANSHLHNDHAGTNLDFPNARTLVRRSEWEHARTLMDEPSSGYVRADFFDASRPPELIDDEVHDILGDGSIVLLATVGHTPGHQSLQITFPSGRRFVLTGDAVYTEDDLTRTAPPAIAWRPDLAAASARLLGDLRRDGAEVLVCHDGPTWRDVADVRILHEEG